MIKLNPFLKSSLSRLLITPSFKFCINVGYLNPAKHITMNHNINNVYIDQYDVGQYPQVVKIHSEAPRTYQPQIINTVLDIINSHYKIGLTQQILRENEHRSLLELINRITKYKNYDFDLVYTRIINTLATKIIVRQSRWTWVVEQKQRLALSSNYFQQNVSIKISDFINDYNIVIDNLVNLSQWGHSPYILQEPSSLQNHFVNESEKNELNGIADLQTEEAPTNFINALMKMIHS